MRSLSYLLIALLLVGPASASAQEAPVRWQRSGIPTEPPVTVFHSTQSATLPTAETLRKGELLFEISHRFWPAMSQGSSVLWGLDGPVTNRLGLAYAPADRIMVGVLRSNLNDNLELNVKARLVEARLGSTPLMVAVMAGTAVNTETPDSQGYSENESQAYAQLLVNLLLARRVALGAVPTLLHNPRIADATAADTFVLGLHGTLHLSQIAGVFGEWLASETRPDYDNPARPLNDAVSAGLQLETGGHFFKLVLTNSTRLNPAQALPGTPYRFTPHDWRFGFTITRVLSLGS